MKDLRELFEWLEARGQVAHVTREVDPDYELVAVAKKINEEYDSPSMIAIAKIEGQNKEKLRYALNEIGINEAYLFPELEHSTNYVLNKYSTKANG